MFALVAALGTPRAVALVEMGDERPHVREWVDYHLAVGFSHLYVTLSKQATAEVRTLLLSYPLVTVMNGTDMLGNHGTGSMTLRAVRDAGDAPLWVCAFDADEYFSPVDPWTSAASLLARYEAAGQRHLHLPKVWFGDAHESEVKQCVDGPLIARFTQYGPEETGAGKTCFHSSILPPPPPPGGIDAFVDANGTMVEGTHAFRGLAQPVTMADVTGPRALMISHFKPQSWAEYQRRHAWNLIEQHKRPEVFHPSSSTPSASGRVHGEEKGESSMADAFKAFVKRGSGAAYAGHLHRAIRLCAVDGSTFASQLQACGEPGQRLCRLDCRAARRRQGCAEPEDVASHAPEQEHPTRALVRGPNASAVVAALAPILNGSCERLARNGYRCALGKRPARPRAWAETPAAVVSTDAAAVCSTPCARQLLVDPKWHPELLASYVSIWLGVHRDRLWKTPKLEKLRDHKKTQARGYRPAVEPSDKAASDKAAAKAAAKAAVKAAAKAATKQNGDRSREAKAAAKARIRSQARREARRAHK